MFGFERITTIEARMAGEFQARCLGRVRTWNRTTGELTLDPVAIFR